MNTALWPQEQTHGLILEHLKTHHQGQFLEAVAGVANLAMGNGLYPKPRGWATAALGADQLQGDDCVNVTQLVRQLIWQLVVQGIVVPGRNQTNPAEPFCTDHMNT